MEQKLNEKVHEKMPDFLFPIKKGHYSLLVMAFSVAFLFKSMRNS